MIHLSKKSLMIFKKETNFQKAIISRNTLVSLYSEKKKITNVFDNLITNLRKMYIFQIFNLAHARLAPILAS